MSSDEPGKLSAEKNVNGDKDPSSDVKAAVGASKVGSDSSASTASSSSNSRPKTKQEKIKILQRKFILSLPDRSAKISELWDQVQGPARLKVLAELHREIHSLAGTAGSFGLTKLGDQSRHAEFVLKRYIDALPSSHELQSLVEVEINSVCALLCDTDEQETSLSVPLRESAPKDVDLSIYLLSHDCTISEDLKYQLERFGLLINSITSLDEITKQPGTADSQILLLDLEDEKGEQALEWLKEQAIPTAVMSPEDGWDNRLRAIRSGAKAYFPKPTDVSLVLDFIDQHQRAKVTKDFNILIVDDDTFSANYHASLLEQVGMHVRVLEDPSVVLDTLENSPPDLVIMDLYMPNCTGIEAAQIIRQHERFHSLPIVFLSTESEAKRQLTAMEAGGEDFLHKSMEPELFVESIEIRAERFRSLKKLMVSDSLTGLLNHIHLKLAIEREFNLAKRHGVAVSFAMIDIDNFKAVNDVFGHGAGDRIIKGLARYLRSVTRKTDIIGRYGGEEFGVVLHSTGKEKAQELIDGFRENFSKVSYNFGDKNITVNFSAGVAESSEHESASALIEAADNALYRAKNSGRNCVVVN